jgi:prevent-host-death family protein
MNNIWQLQDAKSSFSELVDRALTQGTQIVTRCGKKTVAITPYVEYERNPYRADDRLVRVGCIRPEVSSPQLFGTAVYNQGNYKMRKFPRGLQRKQIQNPGQRLVSYRDVKFGMFMEGLIYLIGPAGLNNRVYFIIKTLYTGASGVLASGLVVPSVIGGGNRR